MTENHAEKERSPIQRLPPTVHCFVPQEPYKSTRPASPKVIEFVVNREVGIRLSDALAGNWANFEGRDDRSLFDGDRLQLSFGYRWDSQFAYINAVLTILSFKPIGCPPWESKARPGLFIRFVTISYLLQIPTTDSTKKLRPITREKLATGVAKSVERFIAVRLQEIFSVVLLTQRGRERNQLVTVGDTQNALGETSR